MDRLSFQDQFRLEGTGRRQPRSEGAGGPGRGEKRRNSEACEEIGGSIVYVEFIYALRNHLSYGKVRKQKGEYIGASLESIAAAAKQSVKIGDDQKVSIVNSPDAGAYPIASFTWFVVPAHIAGIEKRNAITGFLKWMLGPGQTQAAALGYLALPKDLVSREEAALARIQQQ